MHMMLPRMLALAGAVLIGFTEPAAQTRMRFAGMDTNNDGRITRSEWRGSRRSFQVHDWNGDGVLSGDEVRVGARRPDVPPDEGDFDSADREYEFNDWTNRGFNALDHDRDGRIAASEWHFDREGFRRADHNRDGVLSRAEFLNEGDEGGQDEDDDREDRFSDLDVDGDNRISRAEWHGTRARFNVLDENGDGVLSRREVVGADPPQDLFTSLDVNRDQGVSFDEWHWSRATFDQRDTNRDGRLTRGELAGTTAQASRSNAYRAGYDRGQTEGRAAGREDRERNQEWDIEGQREMQSADSVYVASMGPRGDYQAGYRDGFRRGYREGFSG
jgi:Ca2+-binding EF-hand superfamily protein